MNITVNVEGPVDFDTVIGQHLAYDEDGVRTALPMTVGDAIVDKLADRAITDGLASGWGSLSKKIASIRDEVIRERVALEVEDALTKPFQATNQYGESRGKTTTLREEIVRLAGEAMKMDRSNTYSRQPTTAEKVIRDEVDRAIAQELAAVVADEKAKVVAAVRAKAAELIANAVKEGVGR